MATSQDYADIHAMLSGYERTMEEAGDELMQLMINALHDLTSVERAELLGLHQRLVQPKAELDNAAANYARRAAQWPFTTDMQLDATLSRIAAVI